MMLPALLFSGILVAAAGDEAPPAACAAVTAMKSKTLPANSSDPQAGIVHGALLYFGDAFAGALYGTRDGTVWYQDSIAGNSAGSAPRERAMGTLGISAGTSNAGPVQATKPNVADLLAPDVKVRGCF